MVDILCEREGSNLYNSIANSNPERCVRLSRTPSVHVYYALRMKLEQSTIPWLNGFLQLGGLKTLLDSLEKFNGKGFTNFSDAVFQLDCISCIKSVLNTKVGIKYFVEQEDYTSKLAFALNTPNMLPKKQIFELLTVICTYSMRGRYLVMDALSKLKKLLNTGDAFSVVVEELRLSDTAAYRKTLMAFINVVIGSHDLIEERCRVRDKILGLGILDLTQTLKKDEKDVDLAVQFEMFHRNRHTDEENLINLRKVDVTDHESLFNTINNTVSGRAESSDFLHVLQDMYIIDKVGCDKSLLWRTLSKTTNFIANIASAKEADIFLNNLQNVLETRRESPKSAEEEEVGPPLMRRISKKLFAEEEEGKSSKPPGDSSGSSNQGNKCDNTARPQPVVKGNGKVTRRDSGISVTSNPSPYDNVPPQEFKRQGKGRVPLNHQRPKLNKVHETAAETLTAPTKNVKCIPIIKVREDKAEKVTSIWKQMASDNKDDVKLDFAAIQDEYADSGIQDSNDETQLLSNETALSINVFLARLEANPEELAECFSEGDDGSISVHAFRHLMKILPSQQEVNQLREYTGSRYDLGLAEQFMLNLSDIPDYRILLQGLLFKSEFTAKYSKLRDNLQVIVTACRDIIHHPGLRDFLSILLRVANFMNQKSHIGPCDGMKLETLLRFYEVKGQNHHSNLLDTVIQQVEMQNDEIMLFTNDFPTLGKASEHCLDELRLDVTRLNDDLKKLLYQLTNAHNSVKSIFQLFIEDVKSDFEQLHSSIARLKGLSQQMSLYFCVDDPQFDLHDTLKHLHEFVSTVKKCKKNGCQQRQQADQVKTRLEALRNNAPVLHLYGRKSDGNAFSGPLGDKVVEIILNQIHKGEIKRFSSEDRATPDIDGHPLLTRLAAPITSTPAHVMGHKPKLSLAATIINAERELPSPLKPAKSIDIEIEDAEPIDTIRDHDTRKHDVMRPVDLPPLIKHELDLPSPVKKMNLSEGNSPLRDVSNLKVDGRVRKLDDAEEEMCTSWVLERWETNDRKTYVDRVEQITEERFHRKQQMMTGSFIEEGEKGAKRTTGVKSVDDNDVGIKIYPRISCNPCGGHRRSASNIDQSMSAANRWMTYEKDTGTGTTGRPKMESKSNLICLGLEKGGKLLGSQDLDALETLPEDEPVPFKKEKKRSSFGFLKRLSKAVMGQRDDDNSDAKKNKKTKKEKKGKGKRVSIADKENNVAIHNTCASDTNC